MKFLKSLWDEISTEEEIDLWHNKHINVVDDKYNGEKVCVPSRYYYFENIRERSEAIKFNIDKSNDTKLTAKCVIGAKGNKRLLEILRIIQQIGKYQQMLISGLHIEDVHTILIVDDSVKTLMKATVEEILALNAQK